MLENGVVKDSAPARATLAVSGSASVSLDAKDGTRSLFERLGRTAGLNVIFDPDFRSLDAFSFKVDNLDALDAIELLALQTRTFWEAVDSKTILVAPDNQAKRRDFQNVSVKTFYLPNAGRTEMIEVVTALRTILNARYVATVSDSNAIVMRDSANKLALAERIVSDLRKSSSVIATAGFPSGSEAGFVQSRRAAETLGLRRWRCNSQFVAGFRLMRMTRPARLMKRSPPWQVFASFLTAGFRTLPPRHSRSRTSILATRSIFFRFRPGPSGR